MNAYLRDVPIETTVLCRSCGQLRALAEYRLFSTHPAVYMDFCSYCERTQGTLALYRRYEASTTKEVATAVYAIARVPSAQRTEEQQRVLVPPATQRVVVDREGAIRAELERRELCRRRLIYFTTTFFNDYKPGWVHQDIARRLEHFMERVERGESPRLMIAMPPRAGKSALTSDSFPSWVLGRHPDWGVIGASHSITLPTDFSRNIRDRIRDPEYAAVFPDTKLRSDSQGIEAWKTTKGGGYIAAGVGTGINGKGMHIGIADDLLKDAEAASSEVIRKAALAWLQSVFYTRLAPGGGLLYISTRWHDADPAGSLLANEAALLRAGVPKEELDNWEVASYQAIAEQDEYLLSDGSIHRGAPPPGDSAPRLLRARGGALHPERYPLEELLRIKHMMPKSLWSALYQQNPTPDDGDFFKKQDLLYKPLQGGYVSLARRFLVTDYAISKGQQRDYTAIGVFALDANDDLYLLDMVRERLGTFEIAAAIVRLVAEYKPDLYAGEQGQIHAAVWPVVEKELQRQRLYVSVCDTLVPVHDKEVRARPLQARTQMHKFFFSYSGERPLAYDIMEREMLRFPNGTNDDTVDMAAWAARLALTVSLPSPQRSRAQRSWRDTLPQAAGASSSFMAA